MKYVIVDVETTGATNGTKGNPFSASNNLVLSGIRYKSICKTVSGNPRVEFSMLDKGLRWVGTNIKFDLHWLRRHGISLPAIIWDCQYAQYCIERQKQSYISLDHCLEFYGYPPKLDVVRTEYWDKGIDTDEVPLEILSEYLEGDLIKTEQVFKAQLNYLADKPELYRLILLGMDDILVTCEMEWNGLYYNLEASLLEGRKTSLVIEEIDAELRKYADGFDLNFNSNDHISAFLYGGVVKDKYREVYYQTLKSGEVKRKERWSIRELQFPALVPHIKGTEVAKGGYYAVNEDTLIKAAVKANKKGKHVIDLLLKRAKLEKLQSSYYEGIPKLYYEMDWTNGILHGTLNHGITRTSRIASSRPNQQNIPDEARLFLESRFST